MDKPKILIVEDQDLLATNIRLMLKINNYDIVGIATSANEAFNIMETQAVDLVIMDISIQGDIDGIDASKIIKDKWDIPVIYLTAKKDAVTINRAKESSSYGFLTKNIELKEQLPILLEFTLYKHKVEKEKSIQQQALIDSEEKFRSIVNSAKDAIIMLDNDGNVSHWNDSASRIFGYSEKEVLGQSLYQLITPKIYKKLYKDKFTEYKHSGEGDFIGKTIELISKKKNNDIFPIEISMSSVKLKDKWCAFAIIRDITARKAAEKEIERLINELEISKDVIERNANEVIKLNKKLSESENKLKKLNASKDRFFSIIAHDLKAPFQSLLGYSEILSNDLESLNKEEINEFTKDLHSSARQLFKLLENLLNWTRLQRNRYEFTPEKQNLKILVDIVIDILSLQAKQKSIEIINKIDSNINVMIDSNMINTVFRNLISNSIKFTNTNGHIVIDAKILDNEYIEVSVTDDGIGMDEDDQNKLFRIDVKHTTKGTSNEKGTGLGLILCKELVEKNQGKITVESKVNEGTTFKFTLIKATQ